MLDNLMLQTKRLLTFTKDSLYLILPGIPFLAAIIFTIPTAIRAPKYIPVFILNWAFDTIILHALFQRIYLQSSKYIMLILSTFLGCCISVYASAFNDLFTPFALIQNFRSASQLPKNLLLFFFPYSAIISGLICLACFLFIPNWTQPLRLRFMVGFIFAKIILILLSICSFFPYDSNEGVMRNFGYFGVLAADVGRAFNYQQNNNLLANCLNDTKARPILRMDSDFRTRNVVVIQVESLDSAILESKVGSDLVMPCLHSLFKIVPTLQVETNHGGISGSIGTDFQLLTGFRLPRENAFSYNLTSIAPYGLPIFCKHNNIVFELFHGNDPSFWRRNGALQELGIFSWFSSYNVPRKERCGWGVSDSDMVDSILRSIKSDNHSSHLYYWITLSSHVPFDLVDHKRFKGKSEDIKVANVFNYTDIQIQRLIANWPFNNTVFLVFGDHLAPFPSHTKAFVPVLAFYRSDNVIRPIIFNKPVTSLMEVPTIHYFIKELFLKTEKKV